MGACGQTRMIARAPKPRHQVAVGAEVVIASQVVLPIDGIGLRALELLDRFQRGLYQCPDSGDIKLLHILVRNTSGLRIFMIVISIGSRRIFELEGTGRGTFRTNDAFARFAFK